MPRIKYIRFSNPETIDTLPGIACLDRAPMIFLPLFMFVVASTFSPGGATSLATASGARFGLGRSLPLIFGIAVSLAFVAAIAAFGLGNLIARRASLQVVVKSLGSGYLLWLAWRIARSGAPASGAQLGQPLGLFRAIPLLLLNPKSWAMAVSAAAAFTPLAGSPGALAVLLGLSFGIAASVSLTLWCALGVLLARMLRTPRHWRWFNLSMAALLVLSIIPTWR